MSNTPTKISEFSAASSASADDLLLINKSNGDGSFVTQKITKALFDSSSGYLVNGGALGTPASGTLTNCTGLPVASGVSGLGAGVATFLATPTSANLRGALTDEAGTGSAYFVGGALGTPSGGTATNLTGTASGMTAGAVTGLSVASGKTLTASNTVTLTATDGVTLAIGGGGTLGSSAYQSTGTSGANVPLLNGANTWGGAQTFSVAVTGLTFVPTGSSPPTNGLYLRAANCPAMAVNGALAWSAGSDGSLLLGTTTNGGVFGNSKCAVQQNAAGQALSVYQESASGNAIAVRVDNAGSTLVGFQVATTGVGSITTNGSNTTYGTSSDVRLKNNVSDAGDAGAVVDALRVRQWDWKLAGTHEAFGFIAQETVLIYPDAVQIGDDDPVVISKQWGRDDSKLVPLLVKEIQSLRVRVAALEAGQ